MCGDCALPLFFVAMLDTDVWDGEKEESFEGFEEEAKGPRQAI
jgi:hypothetical protein